MSSESYKYTTRSDSEGETSTQVSQQTSQCATVHQDSDSEDDLMGFAGCTPADWLLKISDNRSRFTRYLLAEMTNEIPTSRSLIQRLESPDLPWASEFIKYDWDAVSSDLFMGKEARIAYTHDSRKMTAQLADLVNCFFYTWLRNCFRRRISDPGEPFMVTPFNKAETELYSAALDRHKVDTVRAECEKWRGKYVQCYNSIMTSETWKRIGQRVGAFCRQVGCPDAPNDAVKALEALRRYNIAILRDSDAWKLKAELDAKSKEIRDLTDRLDAYQKIISCLAFRNLVEMLPNQKLRYHGGQEIDNTRHWQNFLSAAKDQAERQARLNQDDDTHPLHSTLDNPRVITGGKGIYAALSSNIHGFSRNQSAHDEKEFAFKDAHFRPEEAAFLHAIVPRFRKPNGSVNFARERERYGVVWEDNRDNGDNKPKGGFMAASDPARPSLSAGNGVGIQAPSTPARGRGRGTGRGRARGS